MKRILATLFLCVSACFGSTVYYIDAGSMSFGVGRGYLASRVTVTLTGTPAYQRRIYNYFDFNSELNISLPPGVSGTCSGGTCNIFTGDDTTSGVYNGTAGTAPTTATQPYSYGVDVVYAATSGACSSATAGIFSFSTAPYNWPVSDSNNGEYGNKIKVDTAGYICAVRFLKGSADTNAHHTVHLWNGSTSLASATSGTEAASGWITVPITPTAISPGSVYTASFGITNGSVYYIKGLAENASPHNGPVRIVSHYADSTGYCDVQDHWPTNPDGLIAAGIVGCGSIKTDGTLLDMFLPGQIDDPSGDTCNPCGTQWGNIEGNQTMVGGLGPGPYAVINTRIEGGGNQWHHDDSGHWWSARGDYYYYRDLFTAPCYVIMSLTCSDGNEYWTRQKLEWKAGHRIYIGGTILERGIQDLASSSDSIAFSNMEYGIQDINLEYNEFRNTVGGYSWSGSYANGLSAAPPAFRGRVANNIFWNLSAYATPGQNAGNAYINNGASGVEDYLFDHNTILPLIGRAPAIFWNYDTRNEGMVVTNNFLPIDSQYHGFSVEGIYPPSSCPGLGESGLNCLWTNFVWKNNVMYPVQWSVTNTQRGDTFSSNSTHDNIVSWYPTLSSQNYIPSSSDLTAMKWFKLPSFPPDNSTYATPGDYHLRMDSPASNAGAYKTTDGKNMGADMQAFAIAQGKVDHIGVPSSGITTTSANVVFIAPDSQACPVDYIVDDSSNGDITSGFTRAADTGTSNRVRHVALTGLTANTPYRYQILCAVEQPLGRFRTR